MIERDIVYENGDYWVCRSGRGFKGFEVYRVGATHSVRCAVIDYDGQVGLDRAKAECDRRAAL